MKHLRLFALCTLLIAAAHLSAQQRYIYADPVTIEAGGEAEIVVRMDLDTYEKITNWSFFLQLPEGITLANAESPTESVELSDEIDGLLAAKDDFVVAESGKGYYFVYNGLYNPDPDMGVRWYYTFKHMNGSHGELMRIAVRSELAQPLTFTPEISSVNIRNCDSGNLVCDGVLQERPDFANTLYIDDTEVLVGNDFTLSVKMRSTVDIEGFAFDLVLPIGMSFAMDDEGYPMVSLSEERAAAEHMNTFSVVKLANYPYNDAVRVIAASSNGSAISAGDGEVCTAHIHIGSGLKAGICRVQMRNISIADTEARSHDIQESWSTITILAHEVGDANGDGNITVADLTAIAHHIMDNTPEGFSPKAADANQDGVIDVADYTAVAHLLLYGSITKPAGARETTNNNRKAIATDLTTIDNTIYIEPVKANAGETLTLSVKMKNSVEAEGFQFDLCLPEGVTVVCDADGLPEASLSTERTTARRTNTFQAAMQPDGSLRVMAASTNASVFTGNDGEVCTVKVRLADDMALGDHALLLRDVAISDANAQSHNIKLVEATLTVSDATGIDEMTTNKPHTTTAIYDLQGRRVIGTPRPGIYIQQVRKQVVR